jgi:hypothetical protein
VEDEEAILKPKIAMMESKLKMLQKEDLLIFE